MSPQLIPGICTATIFQQILIDPPKLQFVSSLSLSNNSHNCVYARKVVTFNKAFNIFLRAYCLDIFPSPIFTIKVVDKIACRYFHLFLTQANNFYKVQVKHIIACLDIIIAQAANQAFVLKAMLGCIQNRKEKRLKQLEIIAAIKNNNMQIEKTIAKEQAKQDSIYL